MAINYIEQAEKKVGKYARVNRKNEAYAGGKNPFIKDMPLAKDPDNRVPVPLAKMAVEDLLGYAARPGDIVTEIERIDESVVDDGYPELIDEILEHNNEAINTGELYQDTLVYGQAFEAMWINPDINMGNSFFMPEFKTVDVNSSAVIESDDIKSTELAGVRFYEVDDGKNVKYAQLYLPEEIQLWNNAKGKYQLTESQAAPFNSPSLYQYVSGRYIQAIFEAEKSIIDAHDKLLSRSVNEIDRFNALIALFPAKVSKEFVDKLKEMKVIDDLGKYEHWPEYLEKNLAGITDFYNQLGDRMERLFHKSIKVPDFSDKSFAGDASGIAIAYKLLGLEFKASSIDAYFDIGLKKRIELINDAIRKSTLPMNPDNYTVKIRHHRNMPVDSMQAAEVAMKLQGIVSKETIIRNLPAKIVDDTEKELERLDAEGQARVDMFGGMEDGNQNDD